MAPRDGIAFSARSTAPKRSSVLRRLTSVRCDEQHGPPIGVYLTMWRCMTRQIDWAPMYQSTPKGGWKITNMRERRADKVGIDGFVGDLELQDARAEVRIIDDYTKLEFLSAKCEFNASLSSNETLELAYLLIKASLFLLSPNPLEHGPCPDKYHDRHDTIANTTALLCEIVQMLDPEERPEALEKIRANLSSERDR
jgi:hypothetical protein